MSWIKPEGTTKGINVYNSLTKSKVPFVTKSNKITWYCCGPTVYDAAHMGHARNYVSTDISRRVLRDYFGYDIEFVQNVTDVDDKIIVRARQNHLFEHFSSTTSVTDAKRTLQKAWPVYADSKLPGTILDTIAPVSADTPASEKVHRAALYDAKTALELSDADKDKFYELAHDVLVFYLDKTQGSTITDSSIFRKLAAYWENDFNKDMAALNVLPPTAVTRVSEYMPEIVTFVEEIVKKGYGYEVDGTVYFDTVAFDAADGHTYVKLQPESKGQQALIEEGEGTLSAKGPKRHPNDFALWKSSKPGEPFWDSPWGKGRPGWHIECSAMASDILGPNIDIHSGGIDLAFPHHDNELAQSEACFDCPQWINYFLHTGHLHIEGQKMSKSLKNFITIKDGLKKYSARQIRLVFIMQQWSKPLDFKESLLSEVRAVESAFTKFFTNVQSLLRERADKADSPTRVEKDELELFKKLDEARVAVHDALCDNLSTPSAITVLLDLIQNVNIYLKSATNPGLSAITDIARYITRMLDVFGLNFNDDRIGWTSTSTGDVGAFNKEEVVLPYVKALSSFRDSIRSIAMNDGSTKDILKLCDEMRDITLPKLGIGLDDRKDAAALIKFLSEDEIADLLKQREEKARVEAEKAQKKEAARLKAQKLLEEKKEKAKTKPEDMFKTEEFSQWDDKGIPTHNKDGEEISKSQRKKLVKQWEIQSQLHNEFYNKSE
ncbi:hypothetical protein CANCADRAFT_57811 [Tortispora caseinolytica NRRL Y-17796]|uniref:cysteine--tRNA ligase n=1 Tax=Tortispora caseinolytica NRRL Y-17796 TaxID=767744 RepID=A0A1E4TA91_9ASCO|nr:hypothetical protein CANCADRAFT_57811 [Tortispora caseinolytica NRRL Y-17796]